MNEITKRIAQFFKAWIQKCTFESIELHYKVVVLMQHRHLEFIVDTSDKACAPFGFLSGDIIAYLDHLNATVAGVAPDQNGIFRLWYMLDHQASKGRVCCWDSKITNLKLAGFKLVKGR